ncbi:MAG: carboxypeptidase regulatory-like domain-containing protein [candidate division SR1 bacterium]|nr:carboxypeptidase regulatory-like domain-containing protein [candidate division SR1 bacterium]
MKQKYKQLVYLCVIFIFTLAVISMCVFSYFALQKIQDLSKVTFEGIVIATNSEPINNANIKVEDKYTKSDYNGKYSISDLKWGWNQVTIEADNYVSFQTQVYLPFGKTSYQKTYLEGVNYTILKGSIISEDSNYLAQNIQNIVIKINSLAVPLNVDGTFETDKIAIQKVSILIQASFYEDFYRTIDLKSGVTDIGDIILTKKVIVQD